MERQTAQAFQRQNVSGQDLALAELHGRDGGIRHAGDENTAQIGERVRVEIGLREAVFGAVERFGAAGEGGCGGVGAAAGRGGKAQRAEHPGKGYRAKNGSHEIPS